MQAVDAVGVGRRVAGIDRAGGGVVEQEGLPALVGAGVAPVGIGGGDVFPFQEGRQARVLRAAVGIGGVPADLHHRRVRVDRRARHGGALPVPEVTGTGEQRRHPIPSPLRLPFDEAGEVGVADRAFHQGEGRDGTRVAAFLVADGRAEASARHVHVAGTARHRRRDEACKQQGGQSPVHGHPHGVSSLTCRQVRPAGTPCWTAGRCRCRAWLHRRPSGCPASPCGRCGRCCGRPARSCPARRP